MGIESLSVSSLTLIIMLFVAKLLHKGNLHFHGWNVETLVDIVFSLEL